VRIFLLLFLFLRAHDVPAALGESRKEIHARYQTIIFGERLTTTKRSLVEQFRFRGLIIDVIYVDDQSVEETFRKIESPESALKLLRELHPDAEWMEDQRDAKQTTWKSGVFAATYQEGKLKLAINGVKTGR
jgi:hypothetical protein